MISNFKINNFRLFGDVEINNLNRVNLIVGKNGSGKSALLEGFLLYFSRVSPDSLHERLHCRQEHWESQQSKYTQQLLSNPIRHLFKGHTIPDINKDGFKLSSDKETIHVKTAAYIREETENGITRRMLLEDEVDECDPDFWKNISFLKQMDHTKYYFRSTPNTEILNEDPSTSRKMIQFLINLFQPME